MEWNEFLAHPEVAENYRDVIPGKYLFLKTHHGFKAKVVSLVEKIHGLLVVNGGIRMLIVSD